MLDKKIRGLVIKRINNLNCPVFICFDCKKQIKDESMGNILWDSEADYAIAVHKDCPSNTLIKVYPMSEELSLFIFNLLLSFKRYFLFM